MLGTLLRCLSRPSCVLLCPEEPWGGAGTAMKGSSRLSEQRASFLWPRCMRSERRFWAAGSQRRPWLLPGAIANTIITADRRGSKWALLISGQLPRQPHPSKNSRNRGWFPWKKKRLPRSLLDARKGNLLSMGRASPGNKERSYRMRSGAEYEELSKVIVLWRHKALS